MGRVMGAGVATAALFAVVGSAGSVVVIAGVQAGCLAHDSPLTPIVTMTVPAGMAALGALVGDLAARVGAPRWWATAIAATLATGALLGALGGLPYCCPQGAISGARDGLGFAAGALLACAPLMALVRRFGRVRTGSLASRSHWIAACSAAGLALAAGSALVAAVRSPLPRCGAASDPLADLRLVAIAGGVVAVAVACILASLWVRGRALWAIPLVEDCGQSESLRRVDFGIGEGRWSSFVCGENPYRDVRPVEIVMTGDPAATKRALGVDFATAAACAVGALAVIAFGSLSRAPESLPRSGKPTVQIEHGRAGWSRSSLPNTTGPILGGIR